MIGSDGQQEREAMRAALRQWRNTQTVEPELYTSALFRAGEAMRRAAGPLMRAVGADEQQTARYSLKFEETDDGGVTVELFTRDAPSGPWRPVSGTPAEPSGSAPRAGDALELIAARRRRQIDKGYTPEHDAHHDLDRALIHAARAYLHAALTYPSDAPPRFPWQWPWRTEDWKPSSPADPIADLVEAGALIVAEIERRLSS